MVSGLGFGVEGSGLGFRVLSSGFQIRLSRFFWSPCLERASQVTIYTDHGSGSESAPSLQFLGTRVLLFNTKSGIEDSRVV